MSDPDRRSDQPYDPPVRFPADPGLAPGWSSGSPAVADASSAEERPDPWAMDSAAASMDSEDASSSVADPPSVVEGVDTDRAVAVGDEAGAEEAGAEEAGGEEAGFGDIDEARAGASADGQTEGEGAGIPADGLSGSARAAQKAAVDLAPPSSATSDVRRDVVWADRVDISQGGAERVEAREVHITMGGAGQVRADELTVSMGGVGLARVGHLELRAQSNAFVAVADEAHIGGGSRVLFLMARQADGAGRAIVDWRSALAVGVGIGLVRLLSRWLRGR